MNKLERTQKVRVTDLKVGDSYFIYGVEQPIIEVIVKDNQITFFSKTGAGRTFNNHLTTRAIIRNEK
tara:strand:+ start:207 stop:407 length:201 start_codon:yes stop_codon:yes gene_type:complete